jgi:hypothetical protein
MKYTVDTIIIFGEILPHNCNSLSEILGRKYEDCPELVAACEG